MPITNKDLKGGLTQKQMLFCDLYLRNNDAKESYLKAYTSNGKSVRNINVMINQLLNKKPVIEYLEHKRGRIDKTAISITAKNILQELGAIGFSNMKDYFNNEGMPRNLNEITPSQGRSIKSCRVIEDKTTGKVYTEIVLHDKLTALDKIAKHLGLYELNNQQSKPTINIANLGSDDLMKLLELDRKSTRLNSSHT